MKNKTIFTFTVIVLVLMPFICSILLGKFTPYSEDNSMQTYIIIWAILSCVITAIVLMVFKRFYTTMETKTISGIILFLLLCPLIGIYGLAAPPDLSVKMLTHPEREHVRYLFLFLAAILFCGFAYLLIAKNAYKLSLRTRQVCALLFTFAIAEFFWEFSHHYHYPEGLKAWLDMGNKVEDFAKNYDTISVIHIGVVGRILQFSLLIWLSILLFKQKYTSIWSPILTIIFGLLGLTSAIYIFFYQFNFPKGFEFLMIFFIPGISFFLLYWLGVAVLTKSSKQLYTSS